MNTAGQIVDYRSHAMRAKSLCCDGSPYRPVSLAHLRPMIHLLTFMHPVAHAGPTVSLSLVRIRNEMHANCDRRLGRYACSWTHAIGQHHQSLIENT